MKRRILSVLLACLIFSFGLSLASCAHECEFSDKWTSDESAHWHACVDPECAEIAQKADHSWSEGAVTTPATQEAEGVMTYTCTVCSHAKTEPIIFVGMTAEEWAESFDESVFENFTYTETGVVSATGVEVTTVSTQKFTEDAIHASVEMAGQTAEETFRGEEVAQLLKSFVTESLAPFIVFDDYEYDAENKLYRLIGNPYIDVLGTTLDEATIKFENGRIVELKYSCNITQSGVKMTAKATATFTDYGTTVIASGNGSQV